MNNDRFADDFINGIRYSHSTDSHNSKRMSEMITTKWTWLNFTSVAFDNSSIAFSKFKAVCNASLKSNNTLLNKHYIILVA